MPSKLPSPQEPFVINGGQTITRTWYRVLNDLNVNSGVLAEPIVVKPNSFFVGGTLDSGSTLEPNTIPNGTVLGNSSGALEAATPQAVAPSLSVNNGTLALAEQPVGTILGNPGPGEAIPQGISIGTGLTLQFLGASWVLNVIPNGPAGTDLAGAQTLSWWRQ